MWPPFRNCKLTHPSKKHTLLTALLPALYAAVVIPAAHGADELKSKTTYAEAYGKTKNAVAVDAAKELPHYPAVEPMDAVATWKVKPGFKIRLAAHESQVRDPIAICFDERGRMFVCEMIDYSEMRDTKPHVFSPPNAVPPLSFVKPEPRLKRSNGHHRDWIDACKRGESAACPFDYGAQLTEIVLLGVLSQRLNKPIRWDSASMKAVGLDAADPLINAPRRPGWELA